MHTSTNGPAAPAPAPTTRDPSLVDARPATPGQQVIINEALRLTQEETERQLTARTATADNEAKAGDELDRWENTWVGRLPDSVIVRMAEGAAERARSRIAEQQQRLRREAKRSSR